MHQCVAIDFPVHDIFGFEDVFYVGGPVVLYWQDGLFKGKTADVPIDERNFQHKAFVSVVDVRLKIEVFPEDFFTLWLLILRG